MNLTIETLSNKSNAVYARLTEEAQNWVLMRANELYDGTRTVSRCWSIAISEVGSEGYIK